MAKKRIQEIKADLLKYLERFQNAIDGQVGAAVGETVRTRMLQLISRGLSPINGYGRFPGYKSQTAQSKHRREARVLRNLLRNNRINNASKTRRNQIKAQIARRKQGLQEAKRGYPFNTKEYKRGQKQSRPVNLTLTGKFLRALEFAVGSARKRVKIEIGFFDPKEAKKESGHREGVNGQPKRPVIPQGSEHFNQTIRLDIMRLLRDAVRKATKRA